MISKKDIDIAFNYYKIDFKYKKRCYKCAKKVNENKYYTSKLKKVFNKLNYDDFKNISPLWDIKDTNKLFGFDIDPFLTNLVIILSYKNHKKNMKKKSFDLNQIKIHKNRVRECFTNDLEKRNYEGVRISQMLWAIYFIRTRIVEIGRLQYEYYSKNIIKIHIPGGFRLDYDAVIKSLIESKSILEKMYCMTDIKYICNSWLLSNQINKIIPTTSNIYKFYSLFDVKDGKTCVSDILNFLYGLKECDNYKNLQESTSLQKNIKYRLINNEAFLLGEGTLKNSVFYV